MSLSKWSHDKKFSRSKKVCARPGCTNTLVDSRGKMFCSDPKCVAIREMQDHETKKARARKYYKESAIYPSSINVTIPKNPKLVGKAICIQCGARGIRGRCKEKFTVQYVLNQKTYAKYCAKHRNAWRRKLWEEKGI